MGNYNFKLFICVFFVLAAGKKSIAQRAENFFRPDFFVWCNEIEYLNHPGSFWESELKEKFTDISIKKSFSNADQLLNRIYTISCNQSDSANVFEYLSKQRFFDFVEPVPKYQFYYTPNDIQTSQWNLKKIKADGAWDFSKGGKNVIIALIDDGLDTAHQDLKGVLWHNKKEIPGNGKDDDLNGFTDDYFGWDVANNDNDPSVKVKDGLVHGTHCAGIMGAVTDNKLGIASIGFSTTIMALKCGDSGNIYLIDPYRAVEYAVNNGANVLSMSWGGGGYSATYEALFAYAARKDVICVAAAGNDGNNYLHYPAAYANVIAVGNTMSNDKISKSSNYGNWIDAMAPGTSIYSTFPGNAYGYLSGTSMATPLVSGLLSLMKSYDTAATAKEIISCLYSGCDNIDSVNSSYVGQMGNGRINAYNSLRCLKALNASFIADRQGVCPGDTVHFKDLSAKYPTSWKWKFPGGRPNTSSAANPTVVYDTIGEYDVELIVGNGAVYDTLKLKKYIWVGFPSATIAGSQIVSKGDFATIEIKMVGLGPWEVEYTDGKKVYSIKNIQKSPHYLLVSPDTTTTYKLVNIRTLNCTGLVYDSALVTVVKPFPSKCDSTFRFIYTSGSTGDDIAYSIIPYDDTSFVVAGKTSSYGSGSYDGFIGRVGYSGKWIWMNTGGGSNDDGFLHVTKDKNQNFYVAGYTNSLSSGRASLMAKFDKNGQQKWKLHYGNYLTYLYQARLSTDNKSVYFVGHSGTNGFGSEDFTVYKIDTSGKVIWVNQYGNTQQQRNLGIYEDDAMNLYTFGNTGIPYPDFEAMLIKMDSSGKILWSKTYEEKGSNWQELIMRMERWDSKHMIMIGRNILGSTQELWVAKIDTAGSIKWSKRITMNVTDVSELIIRDQKILIAGATSNSNNDGFLLQLDSAGNVLKSTTMSSSSSEKILGFSDAGVYGLLISGIKNTGSSNDFMFGKIGCNFSSNCYAGTKTPSVTNSNLGVNAYYNGAKKYSATYSISYTLKAYTPTIKVLCKTGKDSNVKECMPVADFEITEACVDEAAEFQSWSYDKNGYPIKGLFWDFGDSTSLSASQMVKHKFADTGRYTITLIAVSADGKRTCADTIKKEYIIRDNFRFRFMQSDTVICSGDSVQLTDINTICGSEPFTYRWSPVYGVSDSAAMNPYFSPRVTTNYIVTVKDYFGNAITDTFNVVVRKSCCQSYARWESKKNVTCAGDSVHLLNSSDCKKNALYLWSFQGAQITNFNGRQPPALFYTTPGFYPVTLVIADSCSRDTFTANVQIAPLPNSNVISDTTICMPGELILGLPDTEGNYYRWTPAGALNNPFIPDPTATLLQTTKFKVKIISEHSCSITDSVTINKLVSPPVFGSDTTICSGTQVTISSITSGKYIWSTGDTTRSIVVSQPGAYWLSLKVNNCEFTDTINVAMDTVPQFSLGPDTALCQKSDYLILAPKGLKHKYTSAIWDNSSGGLMRQVNQSGDYWLQLSFNKCLFSDTLNVHFDSLNQFTLGPDLRFCDTGSKTLRPDPQLPTGTKYLWSNNSASVSIQCNISGNYWLEASRGTCVGHDTVLITVDSMPVFSLGSDTGLCESNLPFYLSAKNARVKTADNLWWDNSSLNMRPVSGSGLYWLEQSSGICIFRDSIFITVDTIPSVSIQKYHQVCDSKLPITIGPVAISGYKYLWKSGETQARIVINSGGDFQLLVSNGSCTQNDTVKVAVDLTPAFDLGPSDTLICNSAFPIKLKPRNLTAGSVVYNWDNGSNLSERNVSGTGIYNLTITSGLCSYSDSIRIDTLSAPKVELIPDTAICTGDTIILSSGFYPATTYKWNNGKTGNSQKVFLNGLYKLEATNTCGSSSDEVNVAEKDCSCPIYIPNAFTPRISPVNNAFKVVFDCPVDEFRFEVFDRWGGKIFETENPDFEWDGKVNGTDLPVGAYYGIARIKTKRENGGREFYRTGMIYVLD